MEKDNTRVTNNNNVLDISKYPEMFKVKLEYTKSLTCEEYGEQLHKCIFLKSNFFENSNKLLQSNCHNEFRNYAKECLK